MTVRAYIDLSTKIYNIQRLIDYRRVVVFIIRSLVHNTLIGNLMTFFRADPLRREIIENYPGIFEQATRQWLYRDSTVRDRLAIIKNHFRFLQERFGAEAIRQMYLKDGITLWSDVYLGEPIFLKLLFNNGHRKEGLTAIELYLGEQRIYRTIFWIAPNDQGEMALWIGALQGSPGELHTIRDLTKHFFGYRMKNLVLYISRIVAQRLNLERIYAVSNYGFYTNNHLRLDRKLKVSLDEFWQETGGTLYDDPRFFEVPIIEPRKSLDEVESHKRNLYRKRFAALDGIEKQVAKTLASYLVAPGHDLKPAYMFWINPWIRNAKNADKEWIEHESIVSRG